MEVKKDDLSEENYGSGKRVPVGIENSSKALFEAYTLLSSMGIRSYLAFGTCLGIFRDYSLLEWDWDVDLIILGEDVVKFNEELVRESGFTDIKVKKDLPRYIKPSGVESLELYVRTISFKKYGVRVDVDPAYISEDGKSRLILKGRKRAKFCACHPQEWFSNPTQLSYKGKAYFLPGETREYLKSNYGKTWEEPIYGVSKWEDRPCMRKSYVCKKI